MFLIILCLLGLAAAGALMSGLTDNATGGIDLGLVTFTVGDKAIEMKVLTFIIIALLAFIVLYLLFRILGALFRIPKRMRRNREMRVRKREAENMEQGYLQYLSGKSGAAQRLLTKSGDASMPVLASLTAAHAANQIGDSKNREAFINDAIEKAPEHTEAIKLERARMLIQAEDWSKATDTLDELKNALPRNPEVLRMLVKAHTAQQKPAALLELVPNLRRVRALPPAEIDTIENDSSIAVMQAAEEKDTIVELWRSFSGRLKKQPEVVGTYARKMMSVGEHDLAEAELRGAIRRNWNAENVRSYGLCEGSNPAKMLSQAEKWCRRNKADGVAHLTAGRLAIRNELSAKAREFLDRAVQLGAGAEAAKELGLLLESEGDVRSAAEQYRIGLDNVDSVAALPSPAEEETGSEADNETKASDSII